MSDNSIKGNLDCLPQRSIAYISPNSLILSALSVVWTWLKPQLPQQLAYTQCSTPSYNLCSLIKSIRKLEKQYEYDYQWSIHLVNSCQRDIWNLELSYSTDRDRYMESFMINLKKFTKMLPIAKDKYDLLKANADFIVMTLTSLRVCCNEIKEFLIFTDNKSQKK